MATWRSASTPQPAEAAHTAGRGARMPSGKGPWIAAALFVLGTAFSVLTMIWAAKSWHIQ